MDQLSGPARDAPPSIKEITSRAADFRFNVNIPFKYWIHSCKTLCQEASFAMREGDFPRAYLMLYRESTLVMDHLRTHPEYKDRESRKLYMPLLESIPDIVKQLERLKPLIQDQYDEYQRMTSSSSSSSHTAPPPSQNHLSRRRPTKILDVADNVDLAVDLAQKELRKRDSVKAQDRRHVRDGRVWHVPEQGAERDPGLDGDLQAQLEATRRTLDSVTGEHRREQAHRIDTLARDQPTNPSSHSNHYYPPTSRSKPVDYAFGRLEPHLPASPRPQRPPKEPTERDDYQSSPTVRQGDPVPSSSHYHHQPLPPPSRPNTTPALTPSRHAPDETRHLPPRPRKDHLLDNGHDRPRTDGPALPAKEPPLTIPSPQPDDGAQRVAFRPAAHLENGDPLRYVFLPSQLRSSFLDVAAPNTARGLEMCGILCGTPVNNALFITTLIIPEQTSTPDTCETVNESALLDYCIAEDLLMIGWIHTHPTQSCFMSSRDLHTQAGYQVMMPESIAIVCAPRFEPSYGIFRLTNPPGLPYILNCTKTDTFHYHSIDNVYTDAMRPAGHVHEVPKLGFKVHDLRP